MDKFSAWVSSMIATPLSVLIHTLWFGIWVFLSLTTGFDPKLTILTSILTIYGIYLLIFILVDEKLDADRTRQAVKRDLKKSDEVLKKLGQ